MNLKTNTGAKNSKAGLLMKSVLMLLLACIAIGSCKSDGVDVSELTSDCYISDVTLGQMKREVYYGEDKDSIGYVTFSAGSFRMTIDQRDSTITNLTPLPYGTKVDKVLVNVGHSGSLVYRCEDDEEDQLYSSKDSIDFTHPVIFTVYSNDGLSKRSYTMTLNVEKEDGSKFQWTKVDESTYLNADTARMMVVGADGALVMMGCTADGMMSCYRRQKADEQWSINAVQCAGGTAAMDLQTLTLSPAKDKLLMSTKDGSQLLESQDGVEWTSMESAGGKHLIGASNTRLYAIADSLLYSKADGEEWKQETTDADKTFTPLYNVHLLTIDQKGGYSRMVLVGYNNTEEADTAVVWSKSWRASDDAQTNRQLEVKAGWMSYPHERINRWMLPKMQPLFVFPYIGGIAAFGGKTSTLPSLSTVLYSPDFGLTWKTNAELLLDNKMSGAEGPLAATIDHDNFIWIVTRTDTWCGKLNRLD